MELPLISNTGNIKVASKDEIAITTIKTNKVLFNNFKYLDLYFSFCNAFVNSLVVGNILFFSVFISIPFYDYNAIVFSN